LCKQRSFGSACRWSKIHPERGESKEIFMKIIREKQNLDEMAIQVVSSRKDGLPFRIAIKAPDHKPPHAHVMDLKTGKTELGQFEVSENLPRNPEDIKDYKQGITDEMKRLVFQWAHEPHRALPQIKNWDALYLEWSRNEKW
jgi:hypothetical protein